MRRVLGHTADYSCRKYWRLGVVSCRSACTMLLSGGRVATLPASLRNNRPAGSKVWRRHVSVSLRSMYLQQHSRGTGLVCQAYADNALDGLDEADDFYSILGVVSVRSPSPSIGDGGFFQQIEHQPEVAALTYQHLRGDGSSFCSQACRHR